MLIAVDTETTGLSTYRGHRPFCIQVYSHDMGGHIYYEDDFYKIKPILEDETIDKVGNNIKFDVMMLRSVGIELKGKLHDAMIMGFLFNESTPHNLKWMSETYLNEEKLTDSVRGWLSKHGYSEDRMNKEDRSFYELVPIEIMTPYALKDPELSYKLYEFFKPKLENMGLWELYEQELKLIPILIKMQERGVLVDLEYFKQKKEEYVARLADLDAELLDIIGGGIDYRSNKQLAAYLRASGFALPKTKNDNDAVDRKALLQYADDPLIERILEHRFISKMVDTYINNYFFYEKDGVIHCNLNQTGARSGRFSSSDPNLQNIHKPDDEEPETQVVRRGFTVRPGYKNYYFDFSQMEVAVFVDYAKDDRMIKVVNAQQDFHQLNADELGISRKKAKTFVFALLYGAGIDKIAGMLNVTAEEAKRIKERYFSKFSNVKRFNYGVIDAVKDRGYLFNRYNRRRHLDKDRAYTGVNFLIQGTCADMVKEAMIKVDKLLEGTKSSMLLMVHDELIIEIHDSEEHLIPQIQAIMEDWEHVLNHVKLYVSPEYSTHNWAEKYHKI